MSSEDTLPPGHVTNQDFGKNMPTKRCLINLCIDSQQETDTIIGFN